MTKSTLNQALATYAEVIRGQQETGKEHEPTPTEFFAVISSTLGQSSQSSPDFMIDSIRILDAVTLQASQAVVRGQFRPLSATYMQIISLGTDNASVLKAAVSALGTLLYVQEVGDSFWSSVQALQCVNTLLAFLEDANMKLRRTAHDQLMRLLRLHQQHKQRARALRSYIGDFCMGILRACTRPTYKRSLYIVLFLESAAALLPEEARYSVGLIEVALNLQCCELPVLTAAALRLIDSYLQAPEYDLQPEDTLACVSLLANTPLQTKDMESNTYRYLALGSGLARVHRQITLSKAPTDFFPSICTALLLGCEADFVQVHDAVGTAIKRVIGECLDPASVSAACKYVIEKQSGVSRKQNLASHAPVVIQIAELLQQLLGSLYQHAWLYVVSACKSLFEKVKVLGANCMPGMTGQDVCASVLSKLLIKLASLFQDAETGVLKIDSSTHLQLGETMGAVVQCVGFAHFTTQVPFRKEDSPFYVGIDESREWILSVLHAALRLSPASLCDFAVAVLPTIETCLQAADDEAALGTVIAKTARKHVLQLWSLFPDFCYYGPSDVASWFPRVLPTLEQALKAGNSELAARKDITVHVLTGLSHLAIAILGQVCPQASREQNGSANKITIYNRGNVTQTPSYIALNTAASTVLPAVLAYLEGCSNGDHTFASAVRCVNAWAAVAPANLVTAVAKKLLQLLLQSTAVRGDEQDQAASGWMSILLAVVPFLPQQMVHILYKTVRPLLSVHESISSQKRAYGILDAVLELHGECLHAAEPVATVLAVVANSLMTCHVSARNMRLRCMERLISNLANIKALRRGSREAGDGASDGSSSDSEDSDSMVDPDATKQAYEAAYKGFLAASDTIFNEVLVCQKDANKKSRDSAKALIQIFVRRLTFDDMMTRLMLAMSSKSDTLRASAILTVCSVLLKHHGDSDVQERAANLLSQLSTLLVEENAELSRAVLTYLKVCVNIFDLQLLQNVLPRITAAICSNLGSLKSRFLKRSRGIMRKLLSRLGEDILRPCVPPDSVALLEYLLKLSRRHDSKKDQKERERKSRVRNGSLEEALLDSDDDRASSDGDDDDTARNLQDITATVISTSAARLGVQGQGNRRGQLDDHRIVARPRAIRPEERQDHSLPTSLTDLLEDQTPQGLVPAPTRSTPVGRERSAKRKRSDSMDNEFDEDDDDEKVAGVDQKAHDNARDFDVYDPDEKYRVKIGADGMIRVEENTPEEPARQAVSAVKAKKTTTALVDKSSQEQSSKRRKVSEPGAEYRSKKSGGDVWRKGMLEPHAYIPLDGRLLSKRNQREAITKFGSVVKHNTEGLKMPSHVIRGNRKQRISRRLKRGG